MRTSDPIEQSVLMAVLDKALQQKESDNKRFMDNLSIAVQNGVARAFSD